MVRIRMSRIGTTKKPFYRVMVADRRKPRDGSIIEQVGYYDPRTEPKTLKLDLARIDHWISVGAQPSPTVARLIKKVRETPAPEVKA